MIEDKANSRRNFIKTTALAAAGFMIVPRHVLGGPGYLAPSDRLQLAGIGAGGKGGSDIASIVKGGKTDVAFLCDVDDRRAANSLKSFPKAKYYKDVFSRWYTIIRQSETSRQDYSKKHFLWQLVELLSEKADIEPFLEYINS